MQRKLAVWNWLWAVVFALAVVVAADEKPCTAHDDAGNFYDLTPLKSNKDYQFRSPAGQDFVVNVCRAIANETWAIQVDDPENVAGFTRRAHGDFSIGAANASLLVRDGHPLLLMTNGSRCTKNSELKASTAIRFICDTSVFGPGKPEMIAELPPDDDTACAFFIEWRTHVACPTHEKSATWWLPIILGTIVAIVFALYIIGGTLYNRYVLELRGFDQIPRFSFCSFSDTVTFFRSCMDRVKTQSSGSWHANGGGGVGRGWGSRGGRAGNSYNGLPSHREEEEAMMGGPPGFLDESDDDGDDDGGHSGQQPSSRPAEMDADGVIRL